MQYITWVMSIVSIITLILMGNKSKWGPRLGLANQILWIAFVLYTKQYGLLLGVVVYTIVHIRNMITWEKA